MAESGLSTAHTTLIRRVQRYALEFENRWGRLARVFGQLRRVDEKVRGKSCYSCCAVDRWSRFAKSCIIETATVGNSRTMRINGSFGMRSAIRRSLARTAAARGALLRIPTSPTISLVPTVARITGPLGV